MARNELSGTADEDAGPASRSRFVRVRRTGGTEFRLHVDRKPVAAVPGESVLVAILASRGELRFSEFDGRPRAGFCLMGACQDCWVWLEDGARLRACTTPAEAGQRILTKPPGDFPSHG